MSDAVNDWNTRMPDTSQIAEVARDYGRMGFDIHTVIIELNGFTGNFDVEFQGTDENMQAFGFEHELGSNGSVERI